MPSKTIGPTNTNAHKMGAHAILINNMATIVSVDQVINNFLIKRCYENGRRGLYNKLKTESNLEVIYKVKVLIIRISILYIY